MTDTLARSVVGRVLRASTTGFDCGARGSRIDERHTFGSFVRVPIDEGQNVWAIGLIYAIRIEDDPLARELVMASFVDNNVLMDQRDNRMVPVEIAVVTIGWMWEDTCRHQMPPRPPMSLTEVELCNIDEIYNFTQRCDFFRLVLNAREVAPDELLAAALNYAVQAYPPEQRREFKVKCGRHIAGLLSHDLKRLSHIIELIRPGDWG